MIVLDNVEAHGEISTTPASQLAYDELTYHHPYRLKAYRTEDAVSNWTGTSHLSLGRSVTLQFFTAFATDDSSGFLALTLFICSTYNVIFSLCGNHRTGLGIKHRVV